MSPRAGRPKTGQIPNISIRLDRGAYRQARVAAVIADTTLGSWLEDAIREKLARDTVQKDRTEDPEC